MKKIILLLLAFIMIMAMASCQNNNPPATEQSSSFEESSTTTKEESSSKPKEESSSEEEEDNSKFPPVERIDYKVSIAQTIDTSIFGKINDFKNNCVEQTYISKSMNITAGGKIEIKQAGIYRVYGTTTKGYILVDIKKEDPLKEVVLILDNVTITSSSDTASIPPIYSEGCNLTIVLPEGTQNTLTDTASNAEKSAIYVKTGNLTICGKGTLNVNGVFKSAILNTKKLTIDGGILNLTAKYHGLYSTEGGVVINDGEIKINAEKSGIKSGDYEIATKEEPEKNVVAPLEINGGRINVISKGDAIDVNGDVTITSGGISIVSDANGIDVRGNLTFKENTENPNAKPAIIDISSIKRGIKCIERTDDTDTVYGKVEILGKTNLKIDVRVSEEEAEKTTDEFKYNKDCIKAVEVVINTTGVVYLKTNETYKADKSYISNPDGSYYIIDTREYVKVDPTLYAGKIIFTIDGSNRGIEADKSIKIQNGIIAIHSAEDCLNAGKIIKDEDGNITKIDGNIEISGGTINLITKEDAVSTNTSITVSGENTQLNILNANKGLKAPKVTVENGNVVIVTLSDTIDADEVVINNGTVSIFEKVDIYDKATQKEGTFKVNGGKLICISTTNSPKVPTSTELPMFATSIEDESNYVYGNYMQIKVAGLDDIVVKIPKSYAKELSVVVVSSEITSGACEVSVGSYEGGIPKNLICTGGTFTAISTENFTK